MSKRRKLAFAIAGIVALVLLVPALSAYVFNPAEEAVDHVAEPVAESLGLTSGICKDGWKDTSSTDEHAKVKSCERTIDGVKWLVILKPDGSFDHGFPLDTPGAEFTQDPAKVPLWK